MRPDAMRTLADGLAFYQHCQMDGTTIPNAQAMQSPRALDQFPSFLFKG
jgi:hypothetical protein